MADQGKLEYAKEAGAVVVGPNSLGLICPHTVKVGMAGGPASDVKKAYSPGGVGIISRSGGMTTEIANLLTTHGIGQSTCISIGGDPVVGSNFLDLIPLLIKTVRPGSGLSANRVEPERRLAEYVFEKRLNLPIIAFRGWAICR
jgi:succinyl-CoA synthetase alpha subunit